MEYNKNTAKKQDWYTGMRRAHLIGYFWKISPRKTSLIKRETYLKQLALRVREEHFRQREEAPENKCNTLEELKQLIQITKR